MISVKENHLKQIVEYRHKLYREPRLKHLFLELTLRCNEHCRHCGSYAGDVCMPEMTPEQYHDVLVKVKEDFDISDMMLCITGGEPLLRKDFFTIMEDARDLGYRWGMTTNATMITKDVAHRLRTAGMKTVSVSIDGLEETHDSFRGLKGGYRRAMEGIQNLIDEGGFRAIQVTTVVNHTNLHELDALWDIFREMDIDSWRIINLEPIGRALQYPELMLTKEDYRTMFDFIRSKRREGWPVQYGCSHYLGLDYEREVRDWYWLCNAGVYTASIMTNGDIGACLDIERRSETIQGNIFKDSFKDVWDNRFEIFRRPLSESCEKCRGCSSAKYCLGDSFHSWNFDKNEPMICMRGILFDTEESGVSE